MHRLKQAWAVLAGRSQALEITTEAADKLTSEAARYGLSASDYIHNAINMHRVGVDSAVAEMELMDEVEETINASAKGL